MEGERTSSIRHISALDGARGAAVAGVLLFHGGHLLGGYLGVDFFFTLSGFLITTLLLAEAGRNGSIGLGGFWARRARRLLPALVVLMLGVALYSVRFADPTQLAQIRGDAFGTLAYIANWRAVAAHQDYWALFTAPSPLQHTWSLAIEEQFYLVWPLVFVGLLAWWKRDAPKAVLVTSLGLAAVSSVLMIVLYNPLNSNRVYYGTDTRAAAILFGAALAAWLSIHGPTRNRRARMRLEIVGLVGALVLAIAWTRLDGQSSRLYHGGFLVVGLAGTAVIAAAVHPKRGPLARALSFRPLCALGRISYGVYLYHWPIDIVFNQQRVGFGGWSLFAVQTAITLIIAVASYWFIEQPIRRGALSSLQWRRLTPAIAFGVVVILFVSALGAHPFVPASATPGDNPLQAATDARVKAPAVAQRIMLVGDSESDFLTVAMLSVDTAHQLALFNAAHAGCTFPNGITQIRVRLPNGSWKYRQGFPCDPVWEADALARFQPQTVLWVVTNPYEGMLYHGQWITPCSEPYDSLYEQNLHAELTNLAAAGAHVVVMTTAYWQPAPNTEFAGIPDTKVLDRYTDCDNAMRRKVAKETGSQLVDLFKYVCPNKVCKQTQDGAVLRADGLHYAGAGGQIVAKWLISQIKA